MLTRLRDFSYRIRQNVKFRLNFLRGQFPTSQKYWNSHTVDVKWEINNRVESLAYFNWRCDQYPGYLSFMPVSGLGGKKILDYGCGPGHDLVGFLEFSHPTQLVGVDVSKKALKLAADRLQFHGPETNYSLHHIDENQAIPFPNQYFDYIHSSGVLHHIDNLSFVLQEFYRVSKQDALLKVMVYNRDSIWWHLYVPYVLQIKEKRIPKNLDLEEAFKQSTDGPRCPISKAFTVESFQELASKSNFEVRLTGSALSLHEIEIFERYSREALNCDQLAFEHKQFLSRIRKSSGNVLELDTGEIPGIDLFLELTKLP